VTRLLSKDVRGRLVSSQCTLIGARSVRTRETTYVISNQIPGRGGWPLRGRLRVGFFHWKVEACFCEAEEELGWDQFECHGFASPARSSFDRSQLKLATERSSIVDESFSCQHFWHDEIHGSPCREMPGLVRGVRGFLACGWTAIQL